MNRLTLLRRPFPAAGLALAALLLPAAFSQTTAPAKNPPPPAPTATARPVADDEVLELSPFVVEAPRDDSYGVLNSNSITSFKTDLEKLPISADVLTETFMEDTASSTLENMLRDYSAGSGTGSAAGDVSGIPVTDPMDRGGGDSVSAGVQLRGLGAAVVKVDGFMLPAPAGTGLNSNFGTERVEVINGPQSLLYGNGGGGGVVNTILKQARFGTRDKGSLKLQIDQYDHELAQFDYSLSRGPLAATISLLHEDLGDRRDWMGGPLKGIYGQLAFKLGSHSILRLSGKYTDLHRFTQQSAIMDQIGGTAVDARHNQRLRYLLATGQIEASAEGPSGAGPLLNGHVNWDNVDSFGGALREEISTSKMGAMTVESNWRPWLATQLSVGYWTKDSMIGYGSGVDFFAPNAAGNPVPGEWTAASGGSTGGAASVQPSDSRAYRFSALFTNELFGGRARSQTIVGAEYIKSNFANESWAYFEVDGNGNFLQDASGFRFPYRLDEGDGAKPYWSVQNGPVKYPWYKIGTETITYNGKTYRLALNKALDPALISPSNPQGVVAHADNNTLYLHSRASSGGIFAVNYTNWMDGRLTTLAGMRYVDARNEQLPSTAIPKIEASDKTMSFSVGANYALNSWLRPYFAVSDTYNLPGILLTVPADPLGNPAQVAHSVGEEIGVKIALGRKLSGSVSVYAVQSTSEPYAINTAIRDDINGAGINGRHLGATGSVISVDRKSAGAQVAITAAPTAGWRLRFSAAYVKGTIGSDTSFATVYNDQFYTNSQGQVTYANGTVVHVLNTGTGSNTPGTAASGSTWVPLTIAKLSDPNDNYYVSPDPVSGLFTTAGGKRGRNVLNSSAGGVTANGSIKTGVTGLPISAYQPQIAGFTPVSEIVTTRSGDRTTGYPEYSLNLTSVYTFSKGAAKGLKLGGTVSTEWNRGDFYYYPEGYGRDAPRKLLTWPMQVRFNGIFGYERKFKKVTWSTQVNVTNMFNDYDIFIRPNATLGFAGQKDAIFIGQPREYIWTNTFKF